MTLFKQLPLLIICQDKAWNTCCTKAREFLNDSYDALSSLNC